MVSEKREKPKCWNRWGPLLGWCCPCVAGPWRGAEHQGSGPYPWPACFRISGVVTAIQTMPAAHQPWEDDPGEGDQRPQLKHRWRGQERFGQNTENRVTFPSGWLDIEKDESRGWLSQFWCGRLWARLSASTWAGAFQEASGVSELGTWDDVKGVVLNWIQVNNSWRRG